MTDPTSKLALFALDHIEQARMADRPDILDEAAELLGEHELAAMCRATAAASRVLETHQLQLGLMLRRVQQ